MLYYFKKDGQRLSAEFLNRDTAIEAASFIDVDRVYFRENGVEKYFLLDHANVSDLNEKNVDTVSERDMLIVTRANAKLREFPTSDSRCLEVLSIGYTFERGPMTGRFHYITEKCGWVSDHFVSECVGEE